MDFEKLKREASDNPLAAIGVGAAALTAVAKLLDAASAAKSRRAYAKQINHKVKSRR